MKVIAFNGSPRKNGNTAFLIDLVLQELQKEGIETELVQLGAKMYRAAWLVTSVLKTRIGVVQITKISSMSG